MDSENNVANLRVASFSSYLSTAENFALKLSGSVQYSPPATGSSHEEASSPVSLERSKNKEEEEISVFGAEKYFNLKLDDENPSFNDNIAGKHGHNKKEIPVDLRPVKSRYHPGTPSASSESSWNSQIALLPRFLRSPNQNKPKKFNGKSFFTGFACNGPCLDKKSVYIDKRVATRTDHKPVMLEERKHSQPGFEGKDELYSRGLEKMSFGSNRQECAAFPVVSSGDEILTVKRQLEEGKAKVDEPRKSLEVFGSRTMKKGDMATNLERKLSMLAWDAIPKAHTFPASSKSSQIYEDAESDGSSDLFEIENISGCGQPMFTRQTSDGMSGCMTPTTRYEPSEASIEWSVVTASAADFSAVSDKISEIPALTSTAKVAKTKSTNKEVQRSRSSSLLGCKSQKAVSVAETAYKTNEKTKSHQPQQHQRSDAPWPARNLQANTKVKDFDSP